MNNPATALKVLAVMAFVLLLSGCGGGGGSTSAGTISGTVSLGRGGPAVVGAKITAGGVVTTTDADGVFQLRVPAGTIDIVASGPDKDGVALASSKLQAVTVKKGATTTVEIIMQKQHLPGGSVTPPTVSVNGLSGTLTGIIRYTVSYTSQLPALEMDLRYGHQELSPDDWYYFTSSTPTPVDITWDTTTVHNYSTDDDGYLSDESYVAITLYDTNYNSTILVVPVRLNNSSSQAPAGTVTDLTAEAVTLGQNLALLAAAPQTTLYVQLQWSDPASYAGIQNYRIYRAFATSGPWEQIAEVPWSFYYSSYDYRDTSSRLSVGQPVYYRVASHNAAGDGPTSSAVMTKPLPRFSVELSWPGNGAFGITPDKFAWRVPAAYKTGGSLSDATFSYSLELAGVTDPSYTWHWDSSQDYQVAETGIGDYMVLSGAPALQAAKQYRWDMVSASVEKVYSRTSGGHKLGWATAYANWPSADALSSGSANGPFNFTTLPR